MATAGLWVLGLMLHITHRHNNRFSHCVHTSTRKKYVTRDFNQIQKTCNPGVIVNDGEKSSAVNCETLAVNTWNTDSTVHNNNKKRTGLD